MNKHQHKIIFNKRLGRMDVVSEIVTAKGGADSGTHGEARTFLSILLKPLSWTLILSLGLSQIAYADVIADPNAPKNQQATILNTASGATQVNIQTPTQGGVSMNQYKEFNTQANGTVLNNSRTNTNTQTAGWIQGNPWLATGSARVIVNQVNSNNPSQLTGNIEIAGKRAELIIANPSGIQINGATILNASRSTFSTGNPIITNGNLTGFQVNQGQIGINGQGLNTNDSDYTDILARSVQINAGIWAKELKVTTGVNAINASNDAVTPSSQSGTTPQFAIDTSALGGMYAGKITLIGTEQGVGVNNAGQIAASAGQVTVDLNGQLSNSGTINSNGADNQTQIKAHKLNNSGTVAGQGNTHIQAGQVNNTGTLAAGRELKLNATEINNSKGTINGQRVELTANSLNNSQGKIQQTGSQALALNADQLNNSNKGLIGYEPLSSGSGTETGSTGNTGTNTSTPSTASGGGSSTVVQPAPVALANGLIHVSGVLNNDAGQITANGGIDLTAKKGLENHATLNLNKLTVSGNHVDNQTGIINADQVILNVDTIDNRHGAILTNTQVHANISSNLNNQHGQISSGKHIKIDDNGRNTLKVDNSQSGEILAAQDLMLQAQGLHNSGRLAAGQDMDVQLKEDFNVDADIQAGRHLSLSSQGTLFNNHKLEAGNTLNLSAREIDNTKDGRIQSNKETRLNASHAISNRGLINSNGLTLIKADNQVHNLGTGQIYGNHIAITTNTLNNHPEIIGFKTVDTVNVPIYDVVAAPSIAARGRLDIAAKTIINQEGAVLSSEGDLSIGSQLDESHRAIGMADRLINGSARIEAQGNASIAVQHLDNLNNHFKVEEYLDSKRRIEEYKDAGNPNKWTEGVDGTFSWGKKRADFKFNDGTAYTWKYSGMRSIRWWDYMRSVYKQRIVENKPGEIVVGGHLLISGNEWRNDNSQILVGGDITNLHNLKPDNTETKAVERVMEEGVYGHFSYKKRGTLGHHEARKDRGGSIANQLTTEYEFEQPITLYEKHLKDIGDNQIKAKDAKLSSGNVDPGQIKTLSDFNTHLPNSSLYHTDPNHPAYMVQTAPAFANYRQWLSSDYMLNALGRDPNNMHKRLGDGYYEQRLIREQVAKLTGYRYLSNYQNDEDQYKALMNAGVTFAKEVGLTPGISLTAEQIARLTSDIVWLVSQSVTLPDGRTQNVLVPKVYIMTQVGDVNSAGALISANTVNLKTTADINNQGTIAGRRLVDISAQNISNSGLVKGQKVLLNAQSQINFNGGRSEAQNVISLKADQINIQSTTSTNGDEQNGQTVLDRVAGLYVSGGQSGVLSLDSRQDTNLNGAVLANASIGGVTQLSSAKGSINLGTIQLAEHETQGKLTDKNHLSLHKSSELGSVIDTQGNILINAADKVNVRQGEINSTDGQITLVGKHEVNVVEGRQGTSLDEAIYNKSRGALSSKTHIDRYQRAHDEAIASNITGQKVNIVSDGNVWLRGSNVVSDQQTRIVAKENIQIEAAQNSYVNHETHDVKKSGLMGTGGIGFMIGKKQESTDTDNTNVTQTGSQVGSLGGKVNIVAGNHYQQTGSSVTSGQSVAGQFVAGDAVNIIAKSVDITAGQNTYATDTIHQTKQSGLTVAVNVPVVNAVMTAVESAKTVGQSKNNRVNAMAAANTAYTAAKAADALKDLQNVKSVKDLNASVSITVGSSKSKQETHSKGTEAVSSTVAGKEVNIIATGAGTDSNIHVQGSNINGTDATRLIADNNVILESAQNTSEEHSSNKSSGWNAGVVVGTQGIGFTAGGNYGRGKGEGSGVNQVNSHVGSKTGQTLIQAGGDTKLAGAQLLGNRAEVDTKNLEIESRQDTNQYNSKQKDMSAQFTVGAGASVSGSYSQNKVNADYASVNEQSGILAGDGGYNVNVKKHTDLKGGIITSTQAAEDAGRNRFSTGTLSASDIQNHADYNASGFGLSGGVSVGAKDSGGTKEDPKTGTKTNLGVGKDNRSLEVTKSIGYGSDSGHDRSVTTSGINTSNITLTDAAGQNATGTSVEQIKAQVKTDTTTDTVQANSGAIANNFDKDAVQKEIGLQVSVTQQFDTTRQGVKAEINKQVDKQQQTVKEAEAALKLNPYDQVAAQKLADANAAIENWQQGGVLVDMIAGGLSGPTSTGAAGTIANAAAPALQYAVGQYFKGQQAEGSTGHIVAHTVLAAAVAAAGGNDALTAGLSAGGAELLAPKVANWLFGNTTGIEKDENGNVIASKLTAEQKQTVSNIVSLGAAGLTAGAGGAGADVAQGAQLASSAVEGNYLNPAQRILGFDAVNNQLARLQGHALTREQYEKRLMELAPKSEEMNKQMVADCLGGKASCGRQKTEAEDYMKWIKAMEDKGFLTPGKFGKGTLQALAQVKANNNIPNVNNRPVQNVIVNLNNDYHVTDDQIRKATCETAGITSFCEPKPNIGNVPIPIGLNAGGAAFGAEGGGSVNLLNGQVFFNGGGSVPISQETDISLIAVPYKYLTETTDRNKNMSDLGRAAYNIDQILNGGGVSATACYAGVCLGANHSFARDQKTGIYDGKTIYSLGLGAGYKSGTGYSVPVFDPFWGDSSFKKEKRND